MSRRCELTGIAVQTGNKVSHSNRKTRTRFLPNLCKVTLISDALGRAVRLRIAAAALRSVEHRGGLDNFLVKAREAELSDGAVALKREILKKRAEAEAKPRPPEPFHFRLASGSPPRLPVEGVFAFAWPRNPEASRAQRDRETPPPRHGRACLDRVDSRFAKRC